MKVTEIWRYPVKTKAGEKLQSVLSWGRPRQGKAHTPMSGKNIWCLIDRSAYAPPSP